MKCLKCGGMQMLRCEHTGGGIYWLCPRCNSTDESASSSYEIVNNKAEDRYRDEHKPSEEFKKSHQHNCKSCADTVCCYRGKDRIAYCCCFYEKEADK